MLSARERVLTIRLMEKLEKHSEYMKHLGIEVAVAKMEERNVPVTEMGE